MDAAVLLMPPRVMGKDLGPICASGELGQPRLDCGATGTYCEFEFRLTNTGFRDGMSFLAWGLLCVVLCARIGR